MLKKAFDKSPISSTLYCVTIAGFLLWFLRWFITGDPRGSDLLWYLPWLFLILASIAALLEGRRSVRD